LGWFCKMEMRCLQDQKILFPQSPFQVTLRGGKVVIERPTLICFKAPTVSRLLFKSHTFWRLAKKRISKHKTVNPEQKPNCKTGLEYTHVTPHDAKGVLAVVISFHQDSLEGQFLMLSVNFLLLFVRSNTRLYFELLFLVHCLFDEP
jgi:hypothetical protein